MTTHRQLIDRREMLALSLAAAAAASLPGAGAAAAAGTGADDAAAKRLAGLLADFAEEILRLGPEAATSLGLDRGARRALKSRLSSVSVAGDARWAAQARSMIARLRRVDRTRLGAVDQLRYDTVMYAATVGEEGTKFACGRAVDAFFDNGVAPFPVTQQDGAVTAVPEFLDSQHQIANADDAEAYLDRIRAFARQLDEETARIADQAAHGIAPPSFIASNALGQLTAYRRTAIARQKLVTSLVTRTRTLGIKGDWEARASGLVAKEVYPALDRQIAAFARATEHATDAAGIDRLPDGEAFYRWALKIGTTTDMSPQEIHAVGLEQNRAIQSRIDAILEAQGMTQGTVGERLLALNSRPDQLYPDDDAGRAQLIDYCNDRIAALRAMMPRFSHMQLKAALRVKRVPADIQDGAPLGYMNGASIDGARPATYYINLKSTQLWPKSRFPR